MKSMLYRCSGGTTSKYTAVDCTDDSLIQVGGDAVFRCTAVNCTENFILQVGVGEQSSTILRWTVLKTVFYRLEEGAVSKYTAVNSTEEFFIQVGGV